MFLLRRRFLSVRNSLCSLTAFAWVKHLSFTLLGLVLLVALYFTFRKVLLQLLNVELAGPLLVWKLTGMVLLTTFSMVTISSLVIALTTLFYAHDLRFLLSGPLPVRRIFMDKSVETVFFSSWMIVLVVLPYVLALGRLNQYPLGFYAIFFLLLVPFLVLAASLGMAFTLVLMYAFPSSRTRDVIWVLSSLSLTLVYVMLRVSEPERLLRPDSLEMVAQYLNFLQAPTAPYMPSWWLTGALIAYLAGSWKAFVLHAGCLAAGAVAGYGLLYYVSGLLYTQGLSGAQEGTRKGLPLRIAESLDARLARRLGVGWAAATLYWKDRKTFFRDVKHWSQILLIAALLMVYLFSIHKLPLDSAEIRNMVSFSNIWIAGFVVAALSLRFTYPAVSLEGRNFWIVKAAPLEIRDLMREKFLFTVIPTVLVAETLIFVSNRLLSADPFVMGLTLVTMFVSACTMCAMGIGFGALFPRFDVANIHQIESSAGGFAYMAASLAFLAATISIEAWPMQMHFRSGMGVPNAWNWNGVAACGGLLILLNAAAWVIPWKLGERTLSRYEK